jgi:hypothetical protein
MAMGLPKMMSGNFASVFPMTSATGRQYAVKCFTREVPHQLERYRLIGSYLNKLRPWWSTDFQFIQDGILVDARRHPVLRMNWVGGATLTYWIDDNVGRPELISGFARRFDEMVQDLAAAGMAHGDLQAGNLLVTNDGQLHLVDYDGMYVPGLENLPPDEVGHPDYQPPSRSRGDYGPGMDRFSAWLISLSLKILAADPALWRQLNPSCDEYLLLDRNDLLDLNASMRFRVLASHRDAEIRTLARLAGDILALPLAAVPTLGILSPAKTRSPAAPAGKAADGLPDWMRNFLPGTADGDGQARPTAQDRRPTAQDRRPTAEGRRDSEVPARWPVGFVVLNLVSAVITLTAWLLYRRVGRNRAVAEPCKGRLKAAYNVQCASRSISKIEKKMGEAERSAQRINNSYSKRYALVQSGHDRRRGNVSREITSIDQQLTKLQSARRQQVDRRLKDAQRIYVATKLSGCFIRANDVTGVGAQLVAKLWSAGIRCPSDFSRVEYVRAGRYITAYFCLSNGRRVHVPGIGEVKARRIDQWRLAQVSNAVRLQPAILSPSELQGIDAQFVAQEQQIQDQRVRVTRDVADQIAAIELECRVAFAEVDKEREAKLVPINQRRTALAAEMGAAQSDLGVARRQVIDWDRSLAGIGHSGFTRFVRTAIKG